MFDNFSKVYVSVEDLAVRIMHVDPDRLHFMFGERILIFLKSDSFYLPSVKTPKMAANPLKKTEIRRYTTEVPAFRPFFQRYGWTLWLLAHLSRRLMGELIVYQSLRRPSVVRPSVCLSVRPSTFSNIFFSETTGPIKLKFHMETP